MEIKRNYSFKDCNGIHCYWCINSQEHIALNYATTTSFHILYKSSFTYHPLIRQ
jgi:hypothetical protein